MKVALYLAVERNSKFVRGKKRAKEEIERLVLSRFAPEMKGESDYVLSIPYETETELDQIIYDEILREAHDIADMRHCFIETDVYSLEDPKRTW